MTIVRRIRENIHGTINVTELEDMVISHPYLQRLRRIKQLAFLQYVFPGASHSRFEHSLGVMHLAGVAWQKLEENQRTLANSSKKYAHFPDLESRPLGENLTHGTLSPTFALLDEVFSDNYPRQALRLAALMHDIGHSPFSHSGEGFMPTWQQMLDYCHNYPDYIATYVRQTASSLSRKGRDIKVIKVRHEVYTLLLIDRVFADIYNQHPNWSEPKIAAQDVASLIATEIPPVAGSPLAKFGLQHLCHELISGEFDVDRMDYLLRDSRECGVVYGIFDESRILNSLAMYWDEKNKELHLAIQFSGLAAFEDYLRARHSMYLQLYFHKTSVAAEAMIKRLAGMIGQWTLPLDAAAYARIDEGNFPNLMVDAARKHIADANVAAYFEKLTYDLMHDRRLWKRVFEVASNAGPGTGIESIDEAATVLRSMGVRFEKVSSSNSLTRFRPRTSNEPSSHTLRLIKKDDFQFPRVIPIEDQLSLVDDNSQVHITRLYVENESDPKTGRMIPDLVRDELHKLIRMR